MPKVSKRSLKKYMPKKVVGWDRCLPLPDKYTVFPDLKWKENLKKTHDTKLIISPNMEQLYLDGRPTVVDLFAGCGGASLGFVKAGWRVIASVELDYWAHVTYAVNIPSYQEAPLHCYTKDIHEITGFEILYNAGINEVDCVIGGPPCQSFSQCNIRKKPGDKGDLLLWQFGRLVKELQPKTFMMENVPGILSKKFPNGKKVIDEFYKYMKEKTVDDLVGTFIKPFD